MSPLRFNALAGDSHPVARVAIAVSVYGARQEGIPVRTRFELFVNERLVDSPARVVRGTGPPSPYNRQSSSGDTTHTDNPSNPVRRYRLTPAGVDLSAVF